MRTYTEYLNSLTVKALREIVGRLGYTGTSKFLKAKLVEIVDMEAGFAHEDELNRLPLVRKIAGDFHKRNTVGESVEITDPAILAIAAEDIINEDADNDFQDYITKMDDPEITRVRYTDLGYNMQYILTEESYQAQNGSRRLTPAQRRRLAKREKKQYGYLKVQLSK